MAVSEKVMICGAYGNKKIASPKEILYIKSSLNNIEYHLSDGSSLSVRGKLDDILPTLNTYIIRFNLYNVCLCIFVVFSVWLYFKKTIYICSYEYVSHERCINSWKRLNCFSKK